MTVMSLPRLPSKSASILAASSVLLLVGCGGTTSTTIKQGSSAARSETNAATSAAAQTGIAPTAPKPATSATSGGQPGARTAAAIVLAHDYTPNDIAEYHAGQALRVLVGTLSGTADGYRMKAFFFDGRRYLGTDVAEPSATIRVVSQSNDEVKIAYQLYTSHDSLEDYENGHSVVAFRLRDGRVTHTGWIPPFYSSKGLSRL